MKLITVKREATKSCMKQLLAKSKAKVHIQGRISNVTLTLAIYDKALSANRRATEKRTVPNPVPNKTARGEKVKKMH